MKAILFALLLALATSQYCQPYYYPKVTLNCKSCPDGAQKDSTTGFCKCLGENEYFEISSWSCQQCTENTSPTSDGFSCQCESEQKYFKQGEDKICWKIPSYNCLNYEVVDPVNKNSCIECPSDTISGSGINKKCSCSGNRLYDPYHNICKSCSLIENMVEGTCKCKEGYILVNDEAHNFVCAECDGNIVNDTCICSNGKYFNNNSNKCVDPPANGNVVEGLLQCNEGYVKDKDDSKCITCSEVDPNSEYKNGHCECKENYRNATELGADICIPTCGDNQMVEIKCKYCPLGNIPQYDIGTDCTCQRPYFFDKKQEKCINIDTGKSYGGSSFLKVSIFMLGLIFFI